MWARPGTDSSLISLLLMMVLGLSFAVTTLHSFRGCAVREFSFIAHKPGCKGMRVHTEACWGRCQTWEVNGSLSNTKPAIWSESACHWKCIVPLSLCFFQKPLPEPPYIQRHHRVCTYSRMRHLTVRLPGCQPNISPLYHYPHALQCDCSVCLPHHTECQTFWQRTVSMREKLVGWEHNYRMERTGYITVFKTALVRLHDSKNDSVCKEHIIIIP